MHVCLRVGSVSVTRQFYADIGSWRVEGADEDGWAVVANGNVRLGLFQSQFMSSEFSLNFRGGDVAAICEEIAAKGHTFTKGPKLVAGGGSASLLDPVGHYIFFDTVPGETKKVDSID